MDSASFSTQSDFLTAALYGDTAKLVKELEKGVNVKSVNDYKRSALHNATIGGQLAIAQLLLVDPAVAELINQPDIDGNTCVHLAALHGRVDCMDLLINNGADFTKANNSGLFPVHLAAKRGHWEVLKLLYHAGVRLDTKCHESERTAIHLAALEGAESVVRGLVTLNAVDMADVDSAGNVATHCAAMGNQLKILRYLVEQGIRADQIPNNLGRYPLHYAAAANAISVVHWILENSPPGHVSVQDSEGNTPAHMAGLYGSAQAFNCLATHGSNLSLSNEARETPLETARRAGHPVLIEKAINNKVECPECKKVRDERSWRVSHPIPSVMQKIAADQIRVFRIKGKQDALFRPFSDMTAGISSSNNNNNSNSSNNHSSRSSRPTSRPLGGVAGHGNINSNNNVSRLGSASRLVRNANNEATGRNDNTINANQQQQQQQLVAIGRDLPTKFYGEHIDRSVYKVQ